MPFFRRRCHAFRCYYMLRAARCFAADAAALIRHVTRCLIAIVAASAALMLC